VKGVVRRRIARKRVEEYKEGRDLKIAKSVIKYNIGKYPKIKRPKEGIISKTIRKVVRRPKKITNKAKKRRIADIAKSVIKYNE
jgi:hypothetical protein